MQIMDNDTNDSLHKNRLKAGSTALFPFSVCDCFRWSATVLLASDGGSDVIYRVNTQLVRGHAIKAIALK